jgi:phosphoglycolate phosphatase
MTDLATTSKNRLDRVRALVFDFDGTLARLEIDFDLMRRRVLGLAGAYGLESSRFAGRYVLETVTAVQAVLAESDAGAAVSFVKAAAGLIEEIELEAARRGGLFPQTRPALAGLKKAGFRLAVITRNFGGAVRIVFPDLNEFCAVFLPREAAVRVKPHPDHLLAALKSLDSKPEETIMVGDHPMDVETGRSAGALTAGVASGRNSRGELTAAGADLVFDHIGELAESLLTDDRST